MLQKWFSGLKPDAEQKNKRCNEEQKAVVKRVVDQILLDDMWRADKRRTKPAQFIRLMHGGPVTGKRHVIKLLKEELFQQKCGWVPGLDFQIGAFQAVNADNVDGDTLHHALGLQPFDSTKKNNRNPGKEKLTEAAKRVAQWRWLIIDEISLISSNFLAELDMHIRCIMSHVSATKRGASNIDRPFGGINVLFVGDFHQLDPPSGTPINAIPTAFLRGAK